MSGFVVHLWVLNSAFETVSWQARQMALLPKRSVGRYEALTVSKRRSCMAFSELIPRSAGMLEPSSCAETSSRSATSLLSYPPSLS